MPQPEGYFLFAQTAPSLSLTVNLICGSYVTFLNVPFCLTYSSCKKSLIGEGQAPRAF